MKTDMKRKMYMGIWRFMLPLPMAISAQGVQRGVSGAETKADLLSEEERKVHHFIVQQMAIAKEPITAEFIGEKLNISLHRVGNIVDKLEAMKTFCYRSDSRGINWAYPLSLENTGHKLTVSTGEQFFAA
ncbi:MAG: hypothetical protein JSW04_12700 [Desulfobacterales bacterium]|nr:MAG: hypothetical protein JSW04_12700 [Desulfobacterales bacterium]